ncbi:MAG: DUF4830 domain-containing protein [Ruminiclostridium sp.]|nr:DUF4830 domain-containing protein [Ruminiclostridium sp.]
MLNKRFTRILLSAVILITAVTAVICNVSADEPDGSTAALVAAFIEENGYKVSSPLTKEITIPSEFSDVYEKYNELQRRQGFDLRRHKGKSAVSYTFNVTGYVDKNGKPDSDVQIHIIVCDGKIVAADIASTRLDGFMEAVRK